MNRTHMLHQLQNEKEWDVLIIGGGATGLGCALDAASRGFKTLLAEQCDFAKATSSRSTKLIHGGVRYLAQGNIKLVMEALRERGRLLRNAPLLTAPLQFIVPVYSWQSKMFYATGLKLYDILSGKLSLGKTKILSKAETLQSLPGLSAHKLYGGIAYFDGQFDDARLAIAIASTAVQNKATLINYCSAKSFLKSNEKICGAVLEDVFTSQCYEVKAKTVINATGIFSDEIMRMDNTSHENILKVSQGIHLVVDKKFMPSANALMIPKTEDGRVLFAVPWHNKLVIGTTDTPLEKEVIEPTPLKEEIDFVIHHANKYFNLPIAKADIQSMFAGMRPLVKQQGKKKTSLLNREHSIFISSTGLITITGGKWTTYRKMAEDTIDKAIATSHLPSKKCITKTLFIKEEKNISLHIEDSFSLSEENIQYFIEQEMAMTVEDILARRTRILFLDAKAAINAAPFVATVMAAHLQKNETWIAQQVDAFTNLAKKYILFEHT